MRPLAALVLALVWGPALGQRITVADQPVLPGVPFRVELRNDTTARMFLRSRSVRCAPPRVHTFALLQPTGELVAPMDLSLPPPTFIAGDCVDPGRVLPLEWAAPASGPGSSGSYVLLFHTNDGPRPRAVTRLDVGTSSPGFPDIHAFPDRMPLARSSHRVRFPPFQSPDWALANTGSQAHFFGGDDRIELFDPGGASPVATRSLSGVFVPPGGVTQVYLPLAGLPLGPYVVQTRWLDPGLGTNQVVRHGIGGDLDLHFPGGRSIPRGGSVPVWIGTRETPTDYAFALSLVPGTGVLPRGCTVPLVPDVLVAACLRDGAGGLVSAFAGRMRLECAGPGFNVVEGIRISHPGPAFSGLVLHAAAIARLPGRSGFIASQPEEIALR